MIKEQDMKDLENIYFDSLHFNLTQTIFSNFGKIWIHTNFMDPCHPRQNFDPFHSRYFLDPRLNFTDPHHPHHSLQSFTQTTDEPTHPHNPRYPRYLADSIFNCYHKNFISRRETGN